MKQIQLKIKELPRGQIMKYLFLDIDGVLNNAEDYCLGYVEKPEMFSKRCLDCLKYITDNVPELKIVLCSTWRILPNWEKRVLQSGMPVDILALIKDVTSRKMDKSEAIKDYINKHNIEISDFAVLDDHDLKVPNQFKTHGYTGLTIIEALKVCDLLNPDFNFPIFLF